jgi:hypothetical protein
VLWAAGEQLGRASHCTRYCCCCSGYFSPYWHCEKQLSSSNKLTVRPNLQLPRHGTCTKAERAGEAVKGYAPPLHTVHALKLCSISYVSALLPQNIRSSQIGPVTKPSPAGRAQHFSHRHCRAADSMGCCSCDGGWCLLCHACPAGFATTTERVAEKAAGAMEDAAEDTVKQLHPAFTKFINR